MCMNKWNLKIDNLRSLSQILTISNFRKIIFKDDSEYFTYWVKTHLWWYHFKRNAEIIRFLYKKLSKDYCNEYIFKNTLLSQKLLEKYKTSNDAIIIDELPVGNSIADFILINGKIQIFEIKTDLDSFVKLDKQICDYKKLANEVYIVVSHNYKDNLLKLYEKTNVGIIYLDKKWNLNTIKEAGNNLNFDHETIFKVLRKYEYINIINKEFWIKKAEIISNSPNTLIFKKAMNLTKKINIKKFQRLALKEIKKRKIDNDILDFNNVPKELRYICYNLNFTKNEYSKLDKFLNTKVV